MADGYGHELLHACIVAGLTPLQREAFIDHAILGRTLQDVGDEYGVTPPAIRSLCDIARRKLADTWGMELAA